MAAAVAEITLAGKQFPVAKLAVRQLRLVLPILSKLVSELGGGILSAQSALDGGASPLAFINALDITPEKFDVILDIMVPVLQRCSPQFTREELLDMEITFQELLVALPTCLQMIGVVNTPKPAPPGSASTSPKDGDAPSGEASPPPS